KSYCQIKDWNVYKVYTDGGFSGSNTERPALEKLIKDAKDKKFDTVLVYKLDRLSRSQKDTLYLIEEIFIKNGIEFLSLQENFDTSTPFGKAMIGLLAVFAQLEREQIKERMQLGKLGRAKAGKAMMWAKVAYGYTYNKETGSLDINPAEAEIVKIVYEEYLNGRSISKLKDYLNENNLNT
ncbi:recombinase family protein, partial [Alistipes putredinis]|uniref:recombinase family protein n=1 Tax=Alistipes putredinis TaxID=28117 RepID=UPI0023AFD8FA